MIREKGFTLIELLITMMIMVIVIALTGPVYNRILVGVKEETVGSEVYQDLITSMEMIRLDIEHAGLGIARNETSMPVTWNEGTKTLQLRSVLNNTNQTTMGWALLNCDTANKPINAAAYIVNQKDTPGLQSMVLLDGDNNFVKRVTAADFKCPLLPPGVVSAYPFDSTVANGCATGWCTTITYQPSAANGPPASKAACAQGTFNLLRSGNPIVNCVADFRVRFDVDNTGDGQARAVDNEVELNAVPSPGTAGPLMDAVMNMEFILLVQAGQRDDDLNTAPNTVVSGTTLSSAGVTNANNYRWKVIKISGKPMSW